MTQPDASSLDVVLRLAASAYLGRYTGFYRTCVIDTVLEHSPADYVRRPRVPNESPVLGLSHLQFEALLAAARESTNQFDFALIAMLGLLGLRISEATHADADDLGEEHGHRVLLVHGKGGKETLVPLPPRSDGPSTTPLTTVPRGRSCLTGAPGGWIDTAPPAGYDGWPRPPSCGCLHFILVYYGTPMGLLHE